MHQVGLPGIVTAQYCNNSFIVTIHYYIAPPPLWPHIITAIIIRMSSFIVICSCIDCSSQSASLHPPHPHVPVVTCALFPSALITKAAPFQLAANICHHVTSDWNAPFSLMWWWGCLATHRRAITCLRNDLPGVTTVHACCRTPMNDSSSRLVHDFLGLHSLSKDCSLLSFSSGRCSSCQTVSIIMPRNSIAVDSPACFSGANGTPRSLQTACRVCRFQLHCSEFGGPIVAKLSK